eukprot:COSAG06_NODE_21771_length_746_cov_0.650696_1_plen_148_part_00
MPALERSANGAAPEYDSWRFWKWLAGLGCTAAAWSARRPAAAAAALIDGGRSSGEEPSSLVLGAAVVACACTVSQCVPSGGMVNIGHRAWGGRGHVCSAEPENSLQSLEALAVGPGLLKERRDFQYLEFDVQASVVCSISCLLPPRL